MKSASVSFKRLCIFGPKGAIQIRYYYYYYYYYYVANYMLDMFSDNEWRFGGFKH